MDTKLVGIIAAIGALAPIASANATVADAEKVMNPSSFSELLDPISNAAAILKVADQQPKPDAEPTMQLAQWHHHHHHDWYWYHHHHHHHYNWFWHHHHHHHHYYHHHHHHHHYW